MVESKTGGTFDQLPSVQALKEHFNTVTANSHLRTLLHQESRNDKLRVEHSDTFIADFTHAKIDEEGFAKLLKVADEAKLFDKIEAMFAGQKINNTEKRSVLHVALRMIKS
jgi:glucose-6-phosphate isomerase